MGKRRFPKKDGIVFKLYYGGSAPGSQTNPPEQAKDLVKHSNVVEEIVDGDEITRGTTIKAQKKESKFEDLDEEEFNDDEEVVEEGESEADEGSGEEYKDEEKSANGPTSAEDKPTHKQQQLGAPSKGKRKTDELDEYDELGFGPDDTYDYTQHIREPGRGVFVPADLEYTEKVLNSLNLSHKVKKLRDMAGKQYVDVDEIEDKEVDAALFGAPDDYYEGALDDDFVLQANGGMPVDVQEVNNIQKLRKGVNKMKLGGSQDDDFLDDDDFDTYDYHEGDDSDGDYDVDATKYIGTDISGDPERKPRLIDEQFDHLLDQYEEANYGEYMNPRDPEVLGQHEADSQDPIFQEYFRAWKSRKGPAQTPSSFNYDAEPDVDKENLKPVDPTEMVREESDAEDEGEDPLTGLYPEKKAEEWDCDTIISTYSNLENHPKLIVEPSNKIKLSQKTGIPLGVLGPRQKSAPSVSSPSASSPPSEHDEESTSENHGKARPKDETPEQRRERKKLMKETKKANREKKKLVKEAYKAEEIKQTTLMVAQRVNQRVVYKF